jgi:uncharacterized protein (TIGR03437 family)
MTLSGANFINNSVVRWNGQDRPTTFVNATQVTAQIPASDIATAGTAQVTVFNPAPGGGTSTALTFTITQPNPLPSISSLNPGSVTVGGAAFTLTVSGTNFIQPSRIRWNGAEVPTTFVSATQLTAQIAASLIASSGLARITVVNPPPGGGSSNEVTLPVAGPLANLSAASFLGQSFAPDSIVAAFGINLATGAEVATTLPLPTTLRGTTVSVRDSAGVTRAAQIFFVSPTQVNYLLPAGLAVGMATVTITAGNGALAVGTIQIERVAPGLFSANANGQGVAAAVVLRVRANGQQVFEQLARFDSAQNRYVPVPIDLGPQGEQVFLIAYGTGIRGRSNQAMVMARLGGADLAVTFADAQGSLAGLDQVNLGPLPRSLAGRGVVELALTVDGRPANLVQVSIR